MCHSQDLHVTRPSDKGKIEANAGSIYDFNQVLSIQFRF